ncbi:unnamed protein product, partial [Ilex paraguariensis]
RIKLKSDGGQRWWSEADTSEVGIGVVAVAVRMGRRVGMGRWTRALSVAEVRVANGSRLCRYSGHSLRANSEC